MQPPKERSRKFLPIRHFIHYSHSSTNIASLEYATIPLTCYHYCIHSLYPSLLHSILGKALDPPTRAWLTDEFGNEVTALRLIPSVEMTTLFCNSDVPGARFQLNHRNPHSSPLFRNIQPHGYQFCRVRVNHLLHRGRTLRIRRFALSRVFCVRAMVIWRFRAREL